jgi:uncharacterized delta-60 repeat protein
MRSRPTRWLVAFVALSCVVLAIMVVSFWSGDGSPAAPTPAPATSPARTQAPATPTPQTPASGTPAPVTPTPSAVSTTAGHLDRAFGDGGRAISGWSGSIDVPYWKIRGAVYGRAFDVDMQSGGRILLTGALASGEAFALARHERAGSLDATFGDGGVVITRFATRSAAYDAAIDDRGRIVAVGTTGRDVYTATSFYDGSPGTEFALARYGPDGALDPSFGSAGKVRTPFSPHGPAQANAVAIQPHGLIMVAGTAGKSLALARYLPDGSLDPSFSSDGKLLVSVVEDATLVTASGVALAAHGGIVVGGLACSHRDCNVFVARFEASGAPDPSFGSGGVVLVHADMTRASNLVAQSDGRLVIGAGLFLYRFEPDGSLDPSFSDDGILPLRLGAAGVAIAADGWIVVAGPGRREPWEFNVSRFDPAGVSDIGFGRHGTATAEFPGFLSTPFAVEIAASGRIIAAGTTSEENVDGAFAVARFLGS